MIDDLEGRLAFIEGNILALRSTFMAQAEMLERLLPGSALATAQSADLKRRAALECRHHDWAAGLEAIVDELRERFDLPAND